MGIFIGISQQSPAHRLSCLSWTDKMRKNMEKNMRAAFLMILEPARPHFRGNFRALPGQPEDVSATRCGTGSLLRCVLTGARQEGLK